jgi:hypothetical protein
MDAAAPLPAPTDQTPTWASASNLARNSRLDQLGRPLGWKGYDPCGQEYREGTDSGFGRWPGNGRSAQIAAIGGDLMGAVRFVFAAL